MLPEQNWQAAHFKESDILQKDKGIYFPPKSRAAVINNPTKATAT